MSTTIHPTSARRRVSTTGERSQRWQTTTRGSQAGALGGDVIYLATSPADALVWASEVARQIGAPTPMALLEVDKAGLLLVHTADTTVGVGQVTTRTDIPASQVHLAECFTAHPGPPPARRTRPGAHLTCPDCGNEYATRNALGAHPCDPVPDD